MFGVFMVNFEQIWHLNTNGVSILVFEHIYVCCVRGKRFD